MRIFLSIISVLLCSTFTPSTLVAQGDTIKIKNGSFEGQPQRGENRYSARIQGWEDCGKIFFPRESPPDIHPKNYWANNKPASHGNTYLGMVVRDVESWESVSQKLTSPIKKGVCYKFSVNLARSDTYSSPTRSSNGVNVNYIEPTVLKVWGGNLVCQNSRLLAESIPINHKRWKRYDFEFEATSNFNFITLEAFYKTPVPLPYNGNILIDNLTDFLVIPCEEEQLLASAEPVKKQPPHKRKPKKVKEKSTTEVAVVEDKPKPIVAPKKKILADLDRKKLHKGQKIRIDELFFKADTSSISASSYPVLDEVYDFMKDNNKVIIEIGGHTNSVPAHDYCDKLSKDRAREVAKYLMERGLTKDRVSYRGYGKRKPIASNFTPEGRKKNQRVEIKILSLDG